PADDHRAFGSRHHGPARAWRLLLAPFTGTMSGPAAFRHRGIRLEAALAPQVSQRLAQPLAAPAGGTTLQRRDRRISSRLEVAATDALVSRLNDRVYA